MKSIGEQLSYLKHFVSDQKNILFEQKINERTDYVTIVLEDLFQSHNQSAIMRSADCFGIQQIHIIENRNRYDTSSSVSKGARNWLNIYKHRGLENNTPQTIEMLKKRGYRIIATTPHTNDIEIQEFDLDKGPAAFFFGTELTGISNIVIDNADEFVRIPMFGFTESLNVSVCAAILMHNMAMRLRSSDIDWHLSAQRKEEVLYQWYRHTIKAFDEILERFNNNTSI